MLAEKATVTAPDDFPGIRIELRRPTAADWGAYQETSSDGNGDEAQLNLLIACGKIDVDEGVTKPEHFGELCDEWPMLPECAFGQLAMMAGTFADGMSTVTVLDLPAVLAAAERVAALAGQSPETAPAAEDIKLATLAERCGKLGLDAETMRTIVACNPKRNSYRAVLVDSIDAVLVLRRPKFSAWSAFRRAGRGGRIQDASLEFACACIEFPGQQAMRSLCERFPAAASSATAICIGLYGNVRVEVGKG